MSQRRTREPSSQRRTTILAVLLLAAAFAGCDGCRKGDAPSSGDAAPPSSSWPGPIETDADGGGATDGDIGRRFRDAEPTLDGARPSAIDPACSGASIDLAAAVLDPRCAIPQSEARKLRDVLDVDGGAPLRQALAREADGRLVVRVTNTSSAPLTLPLSFHAKLPAFTALAETDAHELYELAPPALEGVKAADKAPHIARVVLAPGGVAFARPVVTPAIQRRIVPSCDGGSCAPPELAKGNVVLHVGQLIVDVEAGPPGTLAWTVP